MKHTSFAEMPCPIARSLDVIGDAWTLLIVRDLFFGSSRFDQILGNTGIARNILSARLRKLAADGIVSKTADPEDGRRIQYRLTEKGRDLWIVLVALIEWGDRWEASGKGPLLELRERATGEKVSPLSVRNQAGDVLGPLEVFVAPGAGATDTMRKRFERANERAAT